MLYYFDCGNCGKRKTCESYDEGTFCTEWCSDTGASYPRPGRVDPNPEGWEPEDED